MSETLENKPETEVIEFSFQEDQPSEVEVDDPSSPEVIHEESPSADFDDSDDDNEIDAETLIKREARRVDRQQKKQVKKRIIAEKDERIRRLERQVQEERQQWQQTIAQYNQKFQEYDSLAKQFQQGALDKEYQEIQNLKNHYTSVASQAVAIANGEQWQLANLELEKIRQREFQLAQQKAQAELQYRQQPIHNAVPQQQSQVHPAVKLYVEEFASNNPWVNDPHYENELRRAKIIDLQMIRQGFDPTTQEYWDELEDRVKEQMPYLFDETPAPKKVRSGINNRAVRGTSSAGGANMNTENSNGKKRYVLEPHHKQTLIQLGYLAEDGKKVLNQEKFTKMVKSIYETKAKIAKGGY